MTDFEAIIRAACEERGLSVSVEKGFKPGPVGVGFPFLRMKAYRDNLSVGSILQVGWGQGDIFVSGVIEAFSLNEIGEIVEIIQNW